MAPHEAAPQEALSGEVTVDEVALVPPRFEDWYREARPRVAGAVVVMNGDLDVAGDSADEAMVRAYERWDRVSRMDSPTGWAIQVARNVAKRRLRRHALERRILRRTAEPDLASSLDESDEELWAAVRALPARQRDTVVLRHVSDLSEREIASLMGVSPGTVSTNLREGTRKLEDALAATDRPSDSRSPTGGNDDPPG